VRLSDFNVYRNGFQEDAAKILTMGRQQPHLSAEIVSGNREWRHATKKIEGGNLSSCRGRRGFFVTKEKGPPTRVCASGLWNQERT